MTAKLNGPLLSGLGWRFGEGVVQQRDA